VDEVECTTPFFSASTIAAHYSAATTNNAGYHAQILASNPGQGTFWELDEEAAYVPPNPNTYPTVAIADRAGAGR